MDPLSLGLLGGFDATFDGAPVTGFDSNKVRALLAYLAVESGRAHRRESLAALLWPGYPDRSARTNLRNALANLRTAIGDRETEPSFLLITRETLQFNRASDYWLDVAVLEDALPSAERVPTDQLAEAADLYTGDFLAGFTLEDAVGFDDWASVTGERLRRQVLELLGTLVDRLTADGDAERAVTYARRRVDVEPWLEAAQCQLIRLLAATGQRSAALRQYRSCVRILEEELGATPSAAASALYEEIRATGADPASTESPQVAATVSRAGTPQLPAFLDDGTVPVVSDRSVFVGRAPELARLDDYLDAALAGQGQVAFVVGGPGRGKSSLMRAFAEQAMAAHPDLLVVSGACNAYSGVGDAYLPFREALGMLTGDVESRWRAGRISRDHAQRLWSALPVTLPALVAHGPYVIDTLVSGSGLMSRAEQTGLGGAEWMAELRMLSDRTVVSGLAQQALFQQVTNTLQAVAVERPLLLILDDLQWIDQGSIGLLFHLGRRLAGGRILIVGAYRPEEVAASRSSGGVSEPHPLSKTLSEFRRDFGDVRIDLSGADPSEGRQFVDALVGTEDNRLGEAFRVALYERTGGHPLFTVELVRAMRARGDLVVDADGAWVEGESLDWTTLPVRVEAVIEERLSRLTAQQHDLLAVASVEGETFTAQVLAQVEGLSERAVLRMLSQELVAHHRLVRQAEEHPVGGRIVTQYAFDHALYQEYLYQELSLAERRPLHGEVADSLESLYGEQSAQIAVQLARHYSQAGKVEKAVEFAVRAGDRARLVYANDEAMTHYSRALALLSPSETNGAAAGWRLSALSGLGKLCHRMGKLTESEGYLREAIALGRQMAVDPQELALLYWWLGEALFWQGRNEERVRIGEEGLALLGDDTESVGAALMNQLVAWASGHLGDWARATELSLRTARFIQDLPFVPELGPAYACIRFVHMWDRNLEAASEWLRHYQARLAQLGDVFRLQNSLGEEAGVVAETGDIRGAVRRQRRFREVAARIGNTKQASMSARFLASLYLVLGGVEEAERCADQFLRLAESIGWPANIAEAYIWIGQVSLCQGDWREAMGAFREAESICQDVGAGRIAKASPRRPLSTEADSARVIVPYALLNYDPFETNLAAQARYLSGQARLASGDSGKARVCFNESLVALSDSQGNVDPFHYFLPLLAALETASSTEAGFQSSCRRLREVSPWVSVLLQQWFLEPAHCRAIGTQAIDDGFAPLASAWTWLDPFDDCDFEAQAGLVIRAANGRNLLHLNMSAPRMLRPWPSNVTDAVVQVTCEPVLADRPAIGGLLLWRNKRDYLWLEVGRFGKRDVALGGCLSNKDLVIGRGRLPEGPEPGWAMGEQVTLRLELTDNRVDALCSLDGEQWYAVGHTTFPIDDTVQVGVHAIGMIDRTIYHGAYPEGTAIRFREFRLWGTQEAESEQRVAGAIPDTLPDFRQEEPSWPG